MAMKFGVIVPQGWRMDLVGTADPVEAYETMTRVAQEAEALGYDSIWLYDHFHTVPRPIAAINHVYPGSSQPEPLSRDACPAGGIQPVPFCPSLPPDDRRESASICAPSAPCRS